jgi:hypothetical protein
VEAPVTREPLDDAERAKRDQGRPFIAKNGGGYVVSVPPPPPAKPLRLTEAEGDLIGRRVVYQTADGFQRGWYVWDSPQMRGDAVLVPIVPERVWWRSQLEPDFEFNPADGLRVQAWQLWLDEGDPEYRKAWLAGG